MLKPTHTAHTNHHISARSTHIYFSKTLATTPLSSCGKCSSAPHSDALGLAGGFQTGAFFAPLAAAWLPSLLGTLLGGALSRALVARETGLLPASSVKMPLASCPG